jgi:hypothetical protein
MNDKSPTFDNYTSLAFLNSAESYFDCAWLYRASWDNPTILAYIPGHKGLSGPPIYANSCRAIELALKGYLRGAGKTLKEVKKLGGKYGHDLCCLYEACISLGLAIPTLTSTEQEVIHELNIWYSKKNFDYPDIEFNRDAPDVDASLTIAQKVIQAVAAFCHDNHDKHFNKSTAEISFRESLVKKSSR